MNEEADTRSLGCCENVPAQNDGRMTRCYPIAKSIIVAVGLHKSVPERVQFLLS